MAKTDWKRPCGHLLKAELKRHGVTYAQIVEKLDKIVEEKEANVRNKLSRGHSPRYFSNVYKHWLSYAPPTSR